MEISYSVMAATIPCLKPFMSTISTNWGERPKTEFTNTSPGGSYGLGYLNGKSAKSIPTFSQNTARQTSVVTEELESQDAMDIPYEPVHGNIKNHQMLRGDSVSHTAIVVHESMPVDDRGSMRSNSSQQMIIRKEIKYSVEHD